MNNELLFNVVCQRVGRLSMYVGMAQTCNIKQYYNPWLVVGVNYEGGLTQAACALGGNFTAYVHMDV